MYIEDLSSKAYFYNCTMIMSFDKKYNLKHNAFCDRFHGMSSNIKSSDFDLDDKDL